MLQYELYTCLICVLIHELILNDDHYSMASFIMSSFRKAWFKASEDIKSQSGVNCCVHVTVGLFEAVCCSGWGVLPRDNHRKESENQPTFEDHTCDLCLLTVSWEWIVLYYSGIKWWLYKKNTYLSTIVQLDHCFSQIPPTPSLFTSHCWDHRIVCNIF